jgi:hypothetical protein
MEASLGVGVGGPSSDMEFEPNGPPTPNPCNQSGNRIQTTGDSLILDGG